jgi:hypothetical protein
VQPVVGDIAIMGDRASLEWKEVSERWTLPGRITIVPDQVEILAVALFTRA